MPEEEELARVTDLKKKEKEEECVEVFCVRSSGINNTFAETSIQTMSSNFSGERGKHRKHFRFSKVKLSKFQFMSTLR